MINEDLLTFDDLGDVILENTESSLVTASLDTVKMMAQKDENELSPFWKALFNEWKQQGILN